MSRVLTALTLSLTLATHAAAQRAPSPARQVVENAFRLRDTGAWGELVALVHPEALQKFRAEQLDIARFEELAAAERAVDSESHPSFLKIVYDVKDRTALEALTSEEMLKRWLRTTYEKPESRDSVAAPTSTQRILGEVTEGDSVVHVIFREFYPAVTEGGEKFPATDGVRLITVKRVGGRWKILLNGGIAEEGGAFAIGGGDDVKETPPK
jgi:hypothetical protein